MGRFFFCTAGTNEKPCYFKCGSTKRWDDHMEFEHNITDTICPPMMETPPYYEEMVKCWGCGKEEMFKFLWHRGEEINRYCLSCMQIMFSF